VQRKHIRRTGPQRASSIWHFDARGPGARVKKPVLHAATVSAFTGNLAEFPMPVWGVS
jgi:hypothetical protein